ncbi:MAG: alpha/beta hydrolase fold domain-containing protein [Atopobiaceae bacterium]|nr:alpha/beta hydrolase fold domain-containing protein [Atopobiaceae bacterium]MBQ3283373.1 alpha/beta hydrolase fold domain-containing protein [Atopobiaceae bacterium]
MSGYVTTRRRIDLGDHVLGLLVLMPRDAHGPVPGVLWAHGGGYCTGMASMAHFSRPADLVRTGRAVVVCPDYRLAPAHPYPAGLLDCYAALLWLQEHAEGLGVASDQLFVGGESAGGGLAAALCLLARDLGEVAIAYQMPLYPMLDCRDTATSCDNHGHIWNTRRNHSAWRLYLGGLREAARVPPYASPAQEEDLTGLPAAYTFVCEGEPFLAETLDYVQRLQYAGIDASCDVYHGDVHAFDMMLPWRDESQLAVHRFLERFDQATARCHAEQPRRAHPS